jgi:hypothetical protein
MLETSVADGILNSLRKTGCYRSKKNDITDSEAIPLPRQNGYLRNYLKESTATEVKIKCKWYIKPKKLDLDIPPNQFLSSNTNAFSSTVKSYFHPANLIMIDILKQPVLKFFCQLNSELHIVIGQPVG